MGAVFGSVLVLYGSAAAAMPAGLLQVPLLRRDPCNSAAQCLHVLLTRRALCTPATPAPQQRTQSLHTQVNIMGGAGPDGYPQGYGGYAMPVDTSIPPIPGAHGRHSFPFPSPASAPNAPAAQQIDTSVFVRRSEEDTRFRLLESRMHVDEDAMERMRETIRKVGGWAR
jgi:hypothetical protein